MKKISLIFLAILLSFCLSACSLSASRMQSNLVEAGYGIIEIDEQQLTELNNELKYIYKGQGSIISGFYGVDEATGKSVTVLEFQNKSDLTIMYKIARDSINDSESVDLSGHILVFGDAHGVSAALK